LKNKFVVSENKEIACIDRFSPLATIPLDAWPIDRIDTVTTRAK